MSGNDGIPRKLDDAPVTSFGDTLDAEGERIHGGGFELQINEYRIPVAGTNYLHTAVEMWGPLRPDGTRFYSSLDTNTYRGKDTGLLPGMLQTMGVPYVPGTEMRLTTDQNRVGNWVTKDDNLVRKNVVLEGTGTDVLLAYLRVAEKMKTFNAHKPDYELFPDGEHTNSNSAPLEAAEEAGIDVRHAGGIRNVDLRQTHINIGGVDYTKPGADHLTPTNFTAAKPGLFEAFSGNTAALVENAFLKKETIALMESLNPDLIGLRPDQQAGPKTAMLTVTDAAEIVKGPASIGFTIKP